MTGLPFIPTHKQIEAVHAWQARQLQEQVVRPVVPHLKELFGVSYSEAVAIIRAANNKGGADATP